VKWYCNKVS